MARDPLGHLLDVPASELPADIDAALQTRIRSIYRRPAPRRIATWGVIAVAAAAVVGTIALAARPASTPTIPATSPTSPSGPPKSDTTSTTATIDAGPPQFSSIDVAQGIGSRWNPGERAPIDSFPVGPLDRRYIALPDGSAVTMVGPDGNHATARHAEQEPLCTNLDLVHVVGTAQTPLDSRVPGARAFDVSDSGAVFALRAICPSAARYGEPGTGWEVVSFAPDDPNSPPRTIASGGAGELPDAASDPHPSSMPVELHVSNDGKWVLTKIWDGKISDAQRRYHWDFRRGNGVSVAFDPTGRDDCIIRTRPIPLDAERLLVACTLPFPTVGAGIVITVVDASGRESPWTAVYSTDLIPTEVMIAADPFVTDPTAPRVLLSWSIGEVWKVTILSPADPDGSTPLIVSGPSAWRIGELGFQDLSNTSLEPDSTPRARYCTPTRNSVVRELTEPWEIVAELQPGDCSIEAAEPGNPFQKVNLRSDGDVHTHVTAGGVTGWIQSFGLHAFELPATSGSPEVCRLTDIASADPQYVSPDWGIQGCVDGWALLFHWGSSVTNSEHHVVQWDGQTWITRYRVGDNDAELCNLVDPRLPPGLTRNACTVNFDLNSGQFGNVPNDLTIGMSVDDALRTFRLPFGLPTADSGEVEYPPFPGPPGSNCLRGQTLRVLQWGDLELGFDADDKLFTWSLGQRSGDSFEPIIPPGNPRASPFLYASGGPWIGWTREQFVQSIGNLYLNPDGTTLGPLNPNDDLRPDAYFAIDNDVITGITVSFNRGC